jgi:hypothetical protein
MSDAEEKANIQPGEDKTIHTASFTWAAVGPGSQIGRFRIEQELGRGGMGVVYLAQDTNLGRQVAIKSLPPEIAENTELLSRLKREAKILASLNHPNIATIYEELQEKGIIYLVLEYIAGDTLADRLSRGPLALEEALSVGLQVAEALSAAHNQNVVHRDLKPGKSVRDIWPFSFIVGFPSGMGTLSVGAAVILRKVIVSSVIVTVPVISLSG